MTDCFSNDRRLLASTCPKIVTTIDSQDLRANFAAACSFSCPPFSCSIFEGQNKKMEDRKMSQASSSA